VTADQAPLHRLRRLCLAFPEIQERLNHGEPSWVVRSKTLAQYTERHPADRVSFWCPAPPGAKEALVAAEPDRFYRPRFGGGSWVGVYLDVDPDWAEIHEMLSEAYRLIAPAKLIAELERAT
jgi:hypothetical protein